MFGIFDIDTYNIGTSQGLRCSGHLRCSNFARKSNFAKLAMFDFKRTIAKKAELRKIPRPSRSSNLRKGSLRLPACQSLSLRTTSPSRLTPCHLPYRGEALAYRKALPLRQRLPYQGQRRRPPPAAETGRSCWGCGQQDASDSAADAGSRNPALSNEVRLRGWTKDSLTASH